MSDLSLVIKQFGLDPEAFQAIRISTGLINDTYLLESEGKYILQKINSTVFPEPVKVMDNVSRLFSEISKQLPGYPSLISASSGEDYIVGPDQAYWRLFSYMNNSKVFDCCSDRTIAKQTGKVAGAFQSFLCSLNSDDYHLVIKDFLNIKPRQDALETAISKDLVSRVKEVASELDFIQQFDFSRFDFTHLPNRLTHNDLKLNNILFDQDSREGLAVIDYDTVMPGLVLYDFGDLIRTAASRLPEDSKEIDSVGIDLGIYQVLTESYLSEVRGELTSPEIETLHLGPLYMTVMLGVRFLTDYLEGDRYFQIDYAGHNLIRAKNQLALAGAMEKDLVAMRQVIQECNN